jgi:hypothetical protein
MSGTGRPALRVALLGIGAALAGFALLAGWLGVHAYAYGSARDRATATAVGRVVADGIGDDGDIRVRWTDWAGHQHVQRFGVDNDDRYTKGRTFTVAYDPGQADPRGFPADPDERSAEEDLEVPIVVAGALATVLCGTWAGRGLRYRRAGRRPGGPMTATVLSGEQRGWASDSIWLALSEVDPPGPVIRWQRIMWHPALDRLSGPVPVTVHGNPRGRRAVVAELPDGSRPVPSGRLRHRAPKRVLLAERSAVRADLRDAFILPAGAELAPARPWWRPGVVAAAVGAAAGVVSGFVFGGGGLVPFVGFAIAGAAAFLSLWALSGPQP